MISAPALLSLFTRVGGARFDTATMILLSLVEKILEFAGVRARPSMIMRIGLLPLTLLTVSSGLSFS